MKASRNRFRKSVIRRVGGLEVVALGVFRGTGVIRRVGGLEGHDRGHGFSAGVIRRVGGLEVSTAP